jgi:hypothetical protein
MRKKREGLTRSRFDKSGKISVILRSNRETAEPTGIEYLFAFPSKSFRFTERLNQCAPASPRGAEGRWDKEGPCCTSRPCSEGPQIMRYPATGFKCWSQQPQCLNDVARQNVNISSCRLHPLWKRGERGWRAGRGRARVVLPVLQEHHIAGRERINIYIIILPNFLTARYLKSP